MAKKNNSTVTNFVIQKREDILLADEDGKILPKEKPVAAVANNGVVKKPLTKEEHAKMFPATAKLLAMNSKRKNRNINGVMDRIGLRKPVEPKPMGEKARIRHEALLKEQAKKKADQELAAQGGRYMGEKKASKPNKGFTKS